MADAVEGLTFPLTVRANSWCVRGWVGGWVVVRMPA